MDWSSARSRSVASLLAIALVLAALPGTAAAETRAGGTVVVESGESVDGLTAYAGTVIVRGTVEGDLDAYAGNVFVDGRVTGDVRAYAGNVRIAGEVGGDVLASGGNVFVERDARIDGALEAGAGTVLVAGEVGGDARVGGGSVTLAESAVVGGDLVYDGELIDRGGTVRGAIRQKEVVPPSGPSSLPSIPGWTVDAYAVLVTLAFGAVLLLAFPRLSADVSERVAAAPLRTAGIGLLALIGVPVVLVLVAVTVVGIPLALVGFLLFGLFAWAGAVYGRIAVGSWLAIRAGIESRWAGLVVGVLLVAVLKAALGLVPLVAWLGGLVELGLVLLGAGAVAALLYGAFRARRSGGTSPA